MISFQHAANLSRQLGQMMGLTNPDMPSHRDHWGPVADSPEGREELRRRVRAILHTAGRSSMWTGEDRVRALAEFAKEYFRG